MNTARLPIASKILKNQNGSIFKSVLPLPIYYLVRLSQQLIDIFILKQTL